MAETREPRRLKDPALVAYLQHLACATIAERPGELLKDIARSMGLSKEQFSQAKHGQTASLLVADAFATSRGISLGELRERARSFYRENAMAIVADQASKLCASEEDCEALIRKIRAACRDVPRSADDGSSTPSQSGSAG